MPPAEALGTTRKRTRSANTDDLPSGKKARLAATPSTTGAATSTRRSGRSASGEKGALVAQAGNSVYDLPASDDETQPHNTPTKKPRRSGDNQAARSVYDVPESDDELSAPVVEKRHSRKLSAEQPSANSSTSKRREEPAEVGAPDDTEPHEAEPANNKMINHPAPRQRGRASKVQEVETRDIAQDHQPTADATKAGGDAGSVPGSRTRKKSAKAAENEATTSPRVAAPTVKLAKKPSIWELRRAGTRGEILPSAPPPEAPAVHDKVKRQPMAPAATPGGRKRHANKEVVGDTPKLKGILTPSRKDGTPRTRKSVAFNSGGDAGPEVFFEDLPSKSTGRKAVKSPKELSKPAAAEVTDDGAAVDQDGDTEMQEKEDKEEDEDEEVCSICKKPDSKPPNEIIFCDGCDMAVHQKCYQVPNIPEGDWFCRTCSQDDALLSQTQGLVTLSLKKAEQAPDIPGFEQHLRLMQRVLLDRCTGRRRMPLQGQDDAYQKAFQLVEQTVLAGEGNSMLVIGARGSGKTTLVESIVSEISTAHKDEFHVVRLNGFIHTDDKIALKEIWRQLGKEMDVEDDLINKTNNYADTLASLLAVLSHPSEILDSQQGVTSKSVIFVIDEFDLFATHARQTLLYNLFDIAQARKAPIAVLGLTTRIDVVESLEKRVKSRFSHRYVYLSLAKSLPEFWSICKQGLRVDEDHLRDAGLDVSQDGLGAFLAWWDQRITALHKDPVFQDHLEYHFHSSKSVPAFLTTCILPLASLSPAAPSLEAHFANVATTTTTTLEPPDSKLHLLPSLSDLDLSLLIAAARLDIVAHTDTVNFAMAYDEYTSLMGRQRVQSASSGLLALGGGARVWGRGVAGVSWERLVTLGLLVPAGFAGRGGGGGGGAGGAGLEGKMWKVDVALEEVPGCVKLNQVLARWCREI